MSDKADMLKVTERIDGPAEVATTLSLPFEVRQRSRFIARLKDGRDVGFVLPRGTVLRDGDLVRAGDGCVIQVRAALEAVSMAWAPRPRQLAQLCYHLGNRHAPTEIGDSTVRYMQDDALDALVTGLGFQVMHTRAPFEPEANVRGHAQQHH